MKYFSYEFNKDDRDYRRFFQSRNVSLSKFAKTKSNYSDKRARGEKISFTETSFFPIIAKKMLKI